MAKDILLSNSEIERLIVCPKEFRNRPRDMAKVNKNYQQRFSVFSHEGNDEFTVFIAYSQFQPQDFSLGLILKDCLLLRVNGFHGTTRAGYFQTEHHAYPHAHTLTCRDIQRGNRSKPSKITDMTGAYVDLETARLYFFRHCGVLGFEKYFPVNHQISMFEGEQEV